MTNKNNNQTPKSGDDKPKENPDKEFEHQTPHEHQKEKGRE